MKNVVCVYMQKVGGTRLSVAGLSGGTEGVNRRVEGENYRAGGHPCAEAGGSSQGRGARGAGDVAAANGDNEEGQAPGEGPVRGIQCQHARDVHDSAQPTAASACLEHATIPATQSPAALALRGNSPALGSQPHPQGGSVAPLSSLPPFHRACWLLSAQHSRREPGRRRACV